MSNLEQSFRTAIDDSLFGFSPHSFGTTWITVLALASSVMVTCALAMTLHYLSPPDRRAGYGPLEQVLEDDGMLSRTTMSRADLRKRLRL